jgi:hypothetical protein
MNTILNKATIKSLRQAGFKVRVLHNRPTQKIQKFDGTATEYNPKGGITTIQITSPDNVYDVEGIAICSEKDSWNRRMGNSIALGRAINKLNEEVEKLNNLVLY